MPEAFDGAGLCFLGGAPRSGLALMRRLLAGHPEIRCGADTGIAPAIAMQAADFAATLGSLHRTEFHLDDSDVRRIFGKIVAKCLAPNEDRRVVCEKTSLNVLVFEQLALLLPKARFIHVVRDGRDVASSLLMRDWRSPQTGARFPHVSDPAAAADYWKALATIGLKAEQSLAPSGRLMRVSYESLVDNTADVLADLCDFLGVSDEEIVDAPDEIEWLGMERDSLPMLLQPVSSSQVDISRTRLSPDVRRQIEDIASPALAALGYL
jgi:hypothetical protein